MSRDYGKCKLCLQEGQLQRSHLIPRAYYKLLRTPGADDPNPITADENVTRTSQDQMVQHLLCAGCEDLLNKNGERWVLLHNYRLAGPWPLHQALKAAKAEPEFRSGTVYSSLAIPDVDIEKLVYFGASIFWRASVVNWSIGGRPMPPMRLGGRYEEQFRQYLHGEAVFPRNAALWVAVLRSEEPPPLINFPVCEIKGKYHLHHFDIFGLSYVLYVGGSLPDDVTQYCAVRTPKRLMFFTDIGPVLDRKAAEFFSKSVPAQKLTDRARKDGLRS
jgi:hypothetical protein